MNPLWEACLDKVEEMRGEGWVMAERSPAYVSDQGPQNPDRGRRPRMCIFRAYQPGDGERAVSFVFEIKASYLPDWHVNRDQIEVRVKGPYEDSSDAYWLEQREHDNDRCWIVTPNYVHYVVKKDVSNGEFAGHAGRLFKFELKYASDFYKFQKAGLEVTSLPNEEDPSYARLETRNLWFQGFIPPKHRHLWTPNAETVPEKITTVGI